MGYLVAFSVCGFACVVFSMFQLAVENSWLLPLLVLLTYTIIYFVVSQGRCCISNA